MLRTSISKSPTEVEKHEELCHYEAHIKRKKMRTFRRIKK